MRKFFQVTNAEKSLLNSTIAPKAKIHSKTILCSFMGIGFGYHPGDDHPSTTAMYFVHYTCQPPWILYGTINTLDYLWCIKTQSTSKPPLPCLQASIQSNLNITYQLQLQSLPLTHQDTQQTYSYFHIAAALRHSHCAVHSNITVSHPSRPHGWPPQIGVLDHHPPWSNHIPQECLLSSLRGRNTWGS